MGSPIRILHVVVNLNRGGAETFIMNLFRNIDRSQIQFDFLTCKPGVFDDEIMDLGGKIHRIPYISDVGHFQYVRELNQFFSNHPEYKVVHSHLDKMSGVVLRSAKKAGIPIRISHSHNTHSEGGIATKTYKWMSGKLIIPNSTTYFACSNLAAKWLFDTKANTTNILKNGIEYEKFVFSKEERNRMRLELELDEESFVLGHVGRFDQQKNHSFLIDIFADFCKEHENAVLLLIGDGPLRQRIEEKVKHLQLENKVFFLGIRSDVYRILQAIDLFMFPSLHEGLPLSLIEAQSSGLPCLISNRISDEVDLGMNLVTFLSLNKKTAWIDAMLKIESEASPRVNSQDFIIAQGYDIRKTANRMEVFYKEMLGESYEKNNNGLYANI